jgi:hypothetical protein
MSDEPNSVLTITLSPECRRKNRILVGRIVRSLCRYLGMEVPRPEIAHLGGERLNDIMAANFGCYREEQPFDTLLGHRVLNDPTGNVVAQYEQMRLAHAIHREFKRLQDNYDWHGWGISKSPAKPARLWCYSEDGRQWRGGQEPGLLVEDAAAMLARLEGLKAPASTLEIYRCSGP